MNQQILLISRCFSPSAKCRSTSTQNQGGIIYSSFLFSFSHVVYVFMSDCLQIYSRVQRIGESFFAQNLHLLAGFHLSAGPCCIYVISLDHLKVTFEHFTDYYLLLISRKFWKIILRYFQEIAILKTSVKFTKNIIFGFNLTPKNGKPRLISCLACLEATYLLWQHWALINGASVFLSVVISVKIFNTWLIMHLGKPIPNTIYGLT